MPSTGETTGETEAVAVNVVHRYRLLGHPSDLAGHLGAFGPLPLPARRGLNAWRASFTRVMEASGLTGRGGAAVPAALTLGVAASARGHGIVVVNAMEGEPASRKDWILLIQAPHLVLDGAQLIAAACGADQVVVCVPEHRDAVAAAVGRAVTERAAVSERAAAYAPVREVIVRPPDRFVAGEESALARWMTDRRALPAFRPDKRIPLRLGNRPLLVHNAETLGHVALIARHGADAFRERGIAEEPGTTLVTVSGAVALPGVVEVDRGTPLRDILALANPGTSGRPMPPSRSGPSGRPPASVSSSPSVPRRAASPPPPVSPPTWPARVPVSAGPASSGSPPWRTI
jgi:NADH:ubiquinone oxidoreductase subunit F (NADH-binding)